MCLGSWASVSQLWWHEICGKKKRKRYISLNHIYICCCIVSASCCNVICHLFLPGVAFIFRKHLVVMTGDLDQCAVKSGRGGQSICENDVSCSRNHIFIV